MKKWKGSTSILIIAFIFYLNAVIWFFNGKELLVWVWVIAATLELITGIYYRHREKKQLEDEQKQ
ncbi:hypothetical protein SAMN04487831_10820 [Pseudobutyrivibrio sp. UC1225]|uniref:hypothetical protein n=1 Tax=Pseudobutyrivibrio sp. UC1225 TaxID=1798185 RepID=UPI0008F01471|nr:hypothetical protein [Pseudobutyrivibrio sp. UC1225]SFO09499.1 hypothetical protein SAMN04487831_10820 [Pseudobutyrivibrio sp. UC1225]